MAAKESDKTRDARLRAALRDNLKRRKQAARKASDAGDGKLRKSSGKSES